MFQLRFTNFGYTDHCSFFKFEGAVERAKKCGFECTIIEWGITDEERVVASWSPINGLRMLEEVI
jgi:hypothetical protein